MRHSATKRVHLFDDMTFADTSYCRITRHLADSIEPVCDQKGAGTCAGRGQRRFGSRMPAPNYKDINWSIYWHIVRKFGSIGKIVVIAGNDGSFEQVRLFVSNVFPSGENHVRK